MFDISLNVFPLDSPLNGFAVLQSRVHEVWARFLASSLEDRLRYTPSDCFETFPFPKEYEVTSELEDIGQRYYDLRASIMRSNDEGLTRTYNRFHNPDEDAVEILELRDLHDMMDRAVLDAYGWASIQPRCQFLPELEIEEEEEQVGYPHKKKYRYRWPDEGRDEVLAKLLELNRQRALEEGQVVVDDAATMTAAKPKKSSTRKSKANKAEPTAAPPLFAEGAGEV